MSLEQAFIVGGALVVLMAIVGLLVVALLPHPGEFAKGGPGSRRELADKVMSAAAVLPVLIPDEASPLLQRIKRRRADMLDRLMPERKRLHGGEIARITDELTRYYGQARLALQAYAKDYEVNLGNVVWCQYMLASFGNIETRIRELRAALGELEGTIARELVVTMWATVTTNLSKSKKNVERVRHVHTVAGRYLYIPLTLQGQLEGLEQRLSTLAEMTKVKSNHVYVQVAFQLEAFLQQTEAAAEDHEYLAGFVKRCTELDKYIAAAIAKYESMSDYAPVALPQLRNLQRQIATNPTRYSRIEDAEALVEQQFAAAAVIVDRADKALQAPQRWAMAA